MHGYMSVCTRIHMHTYTRIYIDEVLSAGPVVPHSTCPGKRPEAQPQPSSSSVKTKAGTTTKYPKGPGEWTDVVKRRSKAATLPHQQDVPQEAKNPFLKKLKSDYYHQQQENDKQRNPQLEQECQQRQLQEELYKQEQ